MTRRRWIADETSGRCAALVGFHAAHLTRVLRAHPGQEFDIVTPAGVFRGRITRLDADRVEFALGEEVAAAAVPRIALLLSIFKFDRMEWAIEKGTELGVSRMVPLIAARSDKHLVAAAAKRVERWRRIGQQASEQCRRNTPPEITPPLHVRDAVTLPGAARILLSESEVELTLKDGLQVPSEGEVLLAIGPEGGWTDAELHLFRDAGWTSVSLGSTILRAETAAVAAVAVTLAGLVSPPG